ncbi:MAG: MgtC/SapB family protein [Clostridia bacterium]|nr:MgtC/SapB family protein [Clostridia bacterium]
MEMVMAFLADAQSILHDYNWISASARLLLAVLLGSVIGAERARHGQAAGMRTHALVCLGSALTSLTSIYISSYLGQTGDVARIPAQVISGIGFLGAGMIIVKGNNSIVGLTTAAGMWATAAIGIAVGYGFYSGGVLSAFLCLLTMVFMAKFEKAKKISRKVYVELNDMHLVNSFIDHACEAANDLLEYQVTAAKSGNTSHIGLYLNSRHSLTPRASTFLDMDGVVFALDE